MEVSAEDRERSVDNDAYRYDIRDNSRTACLPGLEYGTESTRVLGIANATEYYEETTISHD